MFLTSTPFTVMIFFTRTSVLDYLGDDNGILNDTIANEPFCH